MEYFNGVEAQPQNLSYDKIIKNTLAQSDELTIRFINGLFNDDIPLDATVEWLDKESVNDKHVGLIADFYPRIAGDMYHIEVEQDDNGDMAVRVFKYAVGGAILHNMTATSSEVTVTFPKPCVVFLKSSANTPKELTWNINYFDGDRKVLKIPAVRLADMSVKEIAEKNLFPIGQFYMRTFEPLTNQKAETFKETAATLLKALENAVDSKSIPYHIGLQMQNTIKEIVVNTIKKSRLEVGLNMDTNFVETLPWIDYREVFQKIEERGRAIGEERGRAIGEERGRAIGEERGRAIGEERGRAERDMEIALNAFRRARTDPAQVIEMLQGFDIPSEIITTAHRQAEKERAGELR